MTSPPEPAASHGAEVEQSCRAVVQAKRAYVSFAVAFDYDRFGEAMLFVEEALASLRERACEPRADLVEHPALLVALERGPLHVTAITFLSDALDEVDVAASQQPPGEASAGEARAGEASVFVMRLRRERVAEVESDGSTAIESWRIVALVRR